MDRPLERGVPRGQAVAAKVGGPEWAASRGLFAENDGSPGLVASGPTDHPGILG